ncbi:MAG TPA: carbohydrate ABC transporter permease [Clostridiales bacterium]|jgi:multiple sugar transport system permease protein|nr:carbohydrate ABC transporter permease [Clostridiales bacterium]HQD30196.1 carbohydrate ABC transporter permease [Clostridiales bacterium]
MARRSWSIVRGVIIAGICFLILYPTLVKLSVSFMPEQDIYDVTVRYVPKSPTLENYKTVLSAMRYNKAFWNTFKLSTLTSVMQLISCTVIGYGFARFRFKGRGVLFALVILTMIVPPQTLMIPLFLHFRYFDVLGIISAITGQKGINLLESYWPFVLMSLTGMGLKNGLYIYIMRQFFRGMPKELEEAAYVDGAGMLRTFGQIMLPSAVPAMVTVFLFSFVWQWTDTFYSSLFLMRTDVLAKTAANVSNQIMKDLSADIGVDIYLSPAISSMYTNTGSLLVVLPLLILYLFAQKLFVESVERTGIVG